MAILTMVTFAALELGCKRGSSRLEGRWRGVRVEGVAPAMQEKANSFANETEIAARGNVITVSTPTRGEQQSAFVVDEETKASIILHTERDGLANKETFVFGDDGKTMTWRMGDGRSITFVRVKD